MIGRVYVGYSSYVLVSLVKSSSLGTLRLWTLGLAMHFAGSSATIEFLGRIAHVTPQAPSGISELFPSEKWNDRKNKARKLSFVYMNSIGDGRSDDYCRDIW